MKAQRRRPTRTGARATAPKRPATPARKNKGAAEYNAPLDEATRALIWTLTEEAKSQRAIAAELGISPSTVSRELARDPVALESLRNRLREARSGRWRDIETRALDETIAWIDALKRVRVQLERAGAKPPSERVFRSMLAIPRALSSLRHAGESATKMVNLLTGGATERMGHEQSADESNPEQLVDMAIEAGLVDRLPPALREYAEEKMRRGAGA